MRQGEQHIHHGRPYHQRLFHTATVV
jgi:hypothetical protein